MNVMRDYQVDLYNRLREKMSRGCRKAILTLSTGAGKCLRIDTPIIMSDGSIKMVQDIIVGDRILGPKGKAKNVISITRGRGEMFKITPIKGDPYVCNSDHVLSLKKTGIDKTVLTLSNGKRIESDEEIINVNIVEYIKSNKTVKHCLKGWRANAIEFPDAEKKELIVPPYILGVWLGDGHSNGPTITKPYCNMVDAWIDYCGSINLKVKIEGKKNLCFNYRATNGQKGKPNIFLEKLRELNVINNKHIPSHYMTASINDRLELIAGLLDSDGYLGNAGYDWISVSEKLANDFAFAVRSVGLACYVSKCEKRIRKIDFTGTYWRCSISGDCERIPCRDKKSTERKQKKRHLVHGIKIEPIGEDDYYGFELDGDGLFLLGDFTVTHNSAIAIEIIKGALAKGKRAAFCVDRIILAEQFAQMCYESGVTDFSIMQANNNLYKPHYQFQIMTAQTLARRDVEPFNLVVVDEAHLIYESLMKKMDEWPESYWIGLTATPYTRGLGRHWDGLVSGITMNELINSGFLVDYDVYGPTKYEPDLEGVETVKGDYNKTQLAERTNKQKLIGDMVEHYRKLIDGKKTMVMAVNIAHAENIAREFNQNGINADFIHCYLDREEIKYKLERFKKDGVMVMASVDMLSRGFDMPNCEAIIVGRPTKSVNYHIQALGRVLRPFDGKNKAIILDHAGNCKRLGMPSDYVPNQLDDGKPKERKLIEKERLPKECSSCGYLKNVGEHKCPRCGFEPKKKHGVLTVAGDLELMDKNKRIKKLKLDSATSEDKAKLYAKLRAGANAVGFNEGWASHKYREYFGVWPKNKVDMDKGFYDFLKNQDRGKAVKIIFSLVK